MDSLFKSQGARHFKSHLVRIYFVVGAIVQSDFHISNWIARQNACFCSLTNAFFDRSDVFPGDSTPDNIVLKFNPSSQLCRLQFEHHVSILAPTTSLSDIAILCFLYWTSDRLAIGDLGPAHARFYPALTQHPIYQHFQVQLAHPRDNSLPCILVTADVKRGIFLR